MGPAVLPTHGLKPAGDGERDYALARSAGYLSERHLDVVGEPFGVEGILGDDAGTSSRQAN
jgi:hypothetical protein